MCDLTVHPRNGSDFSDPSARWRYLDSYQPIKLRDDIKLEGWSELRNITRKDQNLFGNNGIKLEISL